MSSVPVVTDVAEPPDLTELLTVPEVASQLRVSRSTVYRLIERGELAAIRFGSTLRVDRVDLARALHRTPASTARKRRR